MVSTVYWKQYIVFTVYTIYLVKVLIKVLSCLEINSEIKNAFKRKDPGETTKYKVGQLQ